MLCEISQGDIVHIFIQWLCFSGTMFSASNQTPTCRADQKSRSKIVSNKTLVGGLEAGRFSFVGVVRYGLFALKAL